MFVHDSDTDFDNDTDIEHATHIGTKHKISKGTKREDLSSLAAILLDRLKHTLVNLTYL